MILKFKNLDKFMNKNLKVLGIGVLLIGLAVVGWFLYTVSQSQNGVKLTQNNIENQKQEQGKQKSEGQIEELKTEDIDTSNWKIYRNEELGFSFKYPTEWLVFNDGELVDKVSLLYLYPHGKNKKSACSLYAQKDIESNSVTEFLASAPKIYNVRGGIDGIGMFNNFPYKEFSIGTKCGHFYNLQIKNKKIFAYMFILNKTFIAIGGNEECNRILPKVVKTVK
jgi:hypothetical protein